MRLIQTLVPEGKRQLVIEYLEDAEIDYAMTSETSRSDYSDIVYIPTDVDSVEGILDELRDVGVERDGYMIVSDVETIVSDRFEEQQADDEDDEETNGVAEDERISREELQTKARNLSRSTTNYIALTLISAIVATAGLLQDSAAVVVGSMVIAPLIGPAMASCVGTVVSDDALFWEGMRSQAIGLAVAVGSATLFAAGYRAVLAPELELLLIQQVAERAHPGLLSLAIALGAGIAGALSLTSGADEALVGVMIAVALMPPAAAVGLGIAYVDPTLAVGAGVLVSVNLLSINVAGVTTIWVRRYKPTHWYDEKEARRLTGRRLLIFGVSILILTSFLATSSLAARENAQFETEVETIADDATENLLAVEFTYEPNLLTQQPDTVTVRVYGENPPTAAALRERIRERTGVDVGVRVVTEQISRA
ncbi:TIGR00341 family protein [Halonotius aquaticus]|uniref:TIGR00341 family protein n=1 Tax=Halonotius aquaticus TaxID=2216978 RepID=A0A3A6PN89_9EURY|nr:TIGR00341 family protein [Halonotius aquaticus]RJX43643.1 TIGR00341 family protein [Halonotius aquaticus]